MEKIDAVVVVVTGIAQVVIDHVVGVDEVRIGIDGHILDESLAQDAGVGCLQRTVAVAHSLCRLFSLQPEGEFGMERVLVVVGIEPVLTDSTVEGLVVMENQRVDIDGALGTSQRHDARTVAYLRKVQRRSHSSFDSEFHAAAHTKLEASQASLGRAHLEPCGEATRDGKVGKESHVLGRHRRLHLVVERLQSALISDDRLAHNAEVGLQSQELESFLDLFHLSRGLVGRPCKAYTAFHEERGLLQLSVLGFGEGSPEGHLETAAEEQSDVGGRYVKEAGRLLHGPVFVTDLRVHEARRGLIGIRCIVGLELRVVPVGDGLGVLAQIVEPIIFFAAGVHRSVDEQVHRLLQDVDAQARLDLEAAHVELERRIVRDAQTSFFVALVHLVRLVLGLGAIVCHKHGLRLQLVWIGIDVDEAGDFLVVGAADVENHLAGRILGHHIDQRHPREVVVAAEVGELLCRHHLHLLFFGIVFLSVIDFDDLEVARGIGPTLGHREHALQLCKAFDGNTVDHFRVVDARILHVGHRIDRSLRRQVHFPD